MPLYEYVCSKCDLKFELLRSLSQANEEVSCPQCQKAARRVLSTFACFSKEESGATSSIGGSSCASCGATNCTTCGG